MTRFKTFDSSGVATGGRLYAGDLNAIQDRYADLNNFLQQINAGTFAIGDTSIQWTKYGTGEARLSASVRFDGIMRALGGSWVGQFADPTTIAAGSRPYGLTVFNTTKNRLETNIGSDATPSWAPAVRGLVDADVSGSAAIAYSKLNLSGSIVNADIAAGAAIAKSKLAALNIADADISAGAAIAKSKLAALNIVDADISAGAAIAKSKLAALNIGNADISNTAAIAVGKLAPGSNGQALVTSGGVAAWGSLTGVWGGSYPAATIDISDSAITSLKIADNTIVDADISTTAAIAYSKLNLAGSIVNADIAGGAAIAKAKLAALNIVNADVDAAAAIVYSKLSLAGSIVNADISSSAAIAKSKLAALNIVDADVSSSAGIAKSKLAALNIVDSDVSGSAAIALSKIEAVSPSGTSFPGSPYDGQRYTYVADSSSSSVWEMRYRNATAKWEFIGGVPLYFLRDAADTTSSTSWSDIFVSLTAPFAGTYDVEFGGVFETQGGEGRIGVAVGATAPIEATGDIPPDSTVIDGAGWISTIPPGGGEVNVRVTGSRRIRVTVAAGGTAIKLQHKSVDGGSITTTRKWMAITPVKN